jgi:P4 family phage/plasmid primase-like protien
MNNTIMAKYSGLIDFLIKHNAKGSDGTFTHTRIGDGKKIYGGTYNISSDELPTFYQLYYDHIFIKNQNEYLTEKQIDLGPLIIDLDFRYDHSVDTRQHTSDHIHDIITLYLEELKNFFMFDNTSKFEIFVMEKPNVNRTSNSVSPLTKDGIHLMFGLQMDHTMQTMLRDRILSKIGAICDLPLTNTWDTVLDEGISKGTTNWQLYGSQKPKNEAYSLTHYYSTEYNEDEGEFVTVVEDLDRMDIKNNFHKLSVQYTGNPKFDINPSIIGEYNEKLKTKRTRPPTAGESAGGDILSGGAAGLSLEQITSLDQITNRATLENAMTQILNSLNTSEYSIQEIHQYTQILPAKYYEPGSHLLNRQVAFALKHTDDRLFLSWIMLRSKADDFDYNTIPKLFQDWNRHFHSRKDGITKKSIIYWAKQDAYEDYIKVKQNTIEDFIDITLRDNTEFDLAMVLYHMFKDKYICSDIKNKQWYIFKNHKWEEDRGMSLRMAISKDMFNAYQSVLHKYLPQLASYEQNDENRKILEAKIKKISSVSVLLKKTSDKNNIIREASEIFYDENFIKNMDANKYLMCFTNGVVDFKNKVFRDGYPQDYITKSTNIRYTPLYDEDTPIKQQITTFMEQLFPVPELNKYMWEHLASCLIGTNLNQTFNIYCGSGSNGKSLLTDLMSHTLGEYKGTVPITLVTEKRNSIGGTSSEVMQLKGIRYAVMQEPSKESRINEGVMKELTGGDPIQARALYSASEIFEPQFKLVVCTNSLFEFSSNDDGTWRRIRKCDFLSKFADKDEIHNDDTTYLFPKDKGLKEKLPMWAPVFASMLVDLAFELEGNVTDCDIVLQSSNRYRQGQDYISAFVKECIVKVEGQCITKSRASTRFGEWYKENNGNRKAPKAAELHDYLEKVFGKCNKDKKWLGLKIVYGEGEETSLYNDES